MKGTKKINLLNESSSDLILHTDYHRLKRIILNLLTNALKYTSEGYISVSAHISIDDPTVAAVEVKDSGAGMDQDAQIKLFKEFNSNVETNKGTSKSVVNRDGIGLGLSTSLELVEVLGPKRDIQVSSAEGQGSTFSFLIFQDYRIVEEHTKHRATSPQFQSRGRSGTKKSSLLKTIVEISALPNGNIESDMTRHSSKNLLKHQPTNSKSRIEGSSPGRELSARKRVNVMIIESTSLEVHQIRPLLQSAASAYKDEFQLSFFYSEQHSGCVEDLKSIEENKQVTIDLVVAALEPNTPIDRQKALATNARSLSKWWQSRQQTTSMILLINNTKEQLGPFLGLTSGGVATIDFLYVTEGYPSQKDINKFLSNWIRKLN